MSQPHVLVVSHDRVGRHMAGPGIRYRELARVLAGAFRVTLAVPGEAETLEAQPFEVWPYRRDRWASLAPAAHRAGVIVAPGDSLADFPALEHLPTPLVVDGYDPHTLETLALWRGEPPDVQAARHQARLDILRRQCRAADFLICASERQRDWWLGQLEGAGRINPRTYGADPSLRRLVDVVPFGLPAEPPRARQPVIRGVWPGVGPDAEVLLWGGGLWEWLDPLTALRAARRLVDAGRDHLRLLFPGTRHPNPGVPDMPLRAQTLALAEELGLAGTHVLFGDWVAYEEWPAVLLEADVGLSLHPDTVEARLAFRSRVLDYVWAGLPMVLSRGDATADLVAGHGLGLVVSEGDDEAVAQALARLLDEPIPDARFDAARRELTWTRAAEPLLAFCQAPRRAPDKARPQPRLARERPMDSARPLISVIVLTWNGLHYLEACLASLLAQDYPAFEVLVVDNGSTDGTPEWMAEHFPDVRLIRNERNLGFAAGNNVGLRAARGDLLVLLNNDTEVHSGWLAALADTFADPAVGVAGCKLLYPDGTIQHAGAFLYGDRGESEHIGRFAEDEGQFDQPAEVDFVTGAALAISRAALDEIGPLDEGFSPIYFEDVDWCYRARVAGYRIVYQPAAVVTHHESKATDTMSHERKYALHGGRLRLLFKHWPQDRLLGQFAEAELAWLAGLDRSQDLMAARRAYLRTLLDAPGILAFRAADRSEADTLVGLLVDLRAAAAAGLTILVDSVASPPPDLQAATVADLTTPSEDLAPPPTDLLVEIAADLTTPTPVQEGEAESADTSDSALVALREAQTLREHTFVSDVPLLGSLIVAVRNLWNSVATKWYVGAIIQQQNRFNQQAAAYLEILRRQIETQQRQIEGQQRQIEGQRRQIGIQQRHIERQRHMLQSQSRDVTANIRELTAIAQRLAELQRHLEEDRRS